MQFAQCRILLTGASGGIGRSLISHLATQGAEMLLVSRSPGDLELQNPEHAAQVTWIQADITDPAGRDTIIAAVRAAGGVQCLINAAGINDFGLLEEQTEAVIEQMIQLNVTSTLLLTRRLLPILLEQPEAFLVNIGSTFGAIGYPGFAAYCASKFALRGFSEALRRELADTRIRVLYIAPRATRTSMNNDVVVDMNQVLKVSMDEPDTVARKIVAAIQHEQEEVYFGWPEKLFVRLNSLLPKLVDGSLRKQLPIIRRFARR